MLYSPPSAFSVSMLLWWCMPACIPVDAPKIAPNQNLVKIAMKADEAVIARCVVFSVRSAGGSKEDAMKYLPDGFPRSTLGGMWDAWYENWRDDGLPVAAQRSGRPPELSPRKRKRVAAELKAGKTCRQLAGELDVSASTISNVAREQGVVARMPVFRPFLSTNAVKTRLAYARKWLKDKSRPWERVIWTDESAVLLTPHQRHLVWVDVGDTPEAIRSFHFPKATWVWAGISWEGATPLVFLTLPAKGGFKAIDYQKQVLKKVKGFASNIGLNNWMLMEDGARVHTAKLNQQFREKHGIESFPPRPERWPASSPDLNPIEHAWADMKRHLHTLPHYPDDEGTMKRELRKYWLTMTKEKCQALIKNYAQRLEAVVAAEGGNTTY